jgi:glycosyltransferase involved in cell wall biosynthesis
MHVMFIHPNFPSQFGHIANYLATQLKWQCTFVTSIDTKHLQLPFTHINYKVREGPQPKTFYNPNTLQELIDHMTAIYGGMRGVPQIQPDLVVGHMSYGSLLYLRNLYKCPFVGYYELLPPAFWGEGLVLRPEYPPTENVRLFNATYHALTYLHLHAVEAAYTPTHYQLSTAPAELRYKIRVIFDGVDLQFFRRRPYASVSPPSELPPGVPWLQPRPTSFRGHAIGPNTRIVTYVSRGLESMRGFDIFMQTAKRIYEQYDDVIFLIAGEERTNYGHDNHYLPKGQTFKQFVLEQDEYDLSRFGSAGGTLQPERSAHLSDAALRAVVVADAGDGDRVYDPGLGDGAGRGGNRSRGPRSAGGFL